MNTEQALALYEREMLVDQVRSTVDLRMRHLNDLRKVHGDLIRVTYRDLVNYLTDERRLRLKPESRKSIRASLRSFYQWAYSEGIIKADPAYPLKKIPVPKTEARKATDEQVRVGLDVVGLSDRDRAVILLARHGCLRRAEIAALPVSSRHGSHLIVKGKGSKERMVPLTDELLEALKTLEVDGRTVYFPGYKGRHVTPETVWKIVKDHVGINTHSLRHAGATAAYKATHDIRAVQELLGHSNVSTTQRYVHVNEDELRAAAMGTALR